MEKFQKDPQVNWYRWKADFVDLCRESGWGEGAIQLIDWENMRVYYDDGYSVLGAMLEEVEDLP